MKKQRLVEKDYSRLSRKGNDRSSEGAEGKQGSVGSGQRRGQVTVRDQFTSMGRGNLERILVRWSEKSVMRGANAMANRKRESVGRKTVNRGKLQRDRGRVRASRTSTVEQPKTGMYTRVALKGVNGNRMEGLETQLNAIPSLKRRGVGRKGGENQMTWFGEFEAVQSQGMYMEEKDRYGRRTTLKRARSQPVKGTLVDGLKAYYSRSRRKMLRMQGRMRSQVRVSREKTRGTPKS